jgi:ribonuclease BN (tRNA processing enzyme)
MELTVLGSGTATPTLERNASGLVVRSSLLWVLVDIGPGTIRRMCEAHIDTKLIDLILITHFHPDHVSDLVPFLFASNYAFGPVRRQPFHLVGPKGLRQFYDGLVGVFHDWIVPKGDRLRTKEMKVDGPDEFVMGDLTVRSMPSPHSFPSASYRLEAEGVSLTVSGDTDDSEGLVELARDTDLLVCECSMPDGEKVPGHLVPWEAGRIAARAHAQRLMLTHFYPPCDEVDVAKQASATFPGEIIIARDLMVVTV